MSIYGFGVRAYIHEASIRRIPAGVSRGLFRSRGNHGTLTHPLAPVEHVIFEKLIDFGKTLKCLVDEELKSFEQACAAMPQTLERILKKTRQTLLLLPGEQMWALSPDQQKLLRTLASVFTGADDPIAADEALANALAPQALERPQTTKPGDLLDYFLTCIDSAGVAVFDALDTLWLSAPQHGEDSVADRVIAKLEALLSDADSFDESGDTLFVLYDTLFAERLYQEERLEGECHRLQALFAGPHQKLRDTVQTLGVLPAKHAEAWFDLRDLQLRGLLDFEADAVRKIVLAAVSGVKSGKAVIDDNMLTTTVEMDQLDSRAFLSALLASSRKSLSEEIRLERDAFVKKMRQLLKSQEAAFKELLTEQEGAYRAAADARRSACKALLQTKHAEEKLRLSRWSAALVKAVREAGELQARTHSEAKGNAEGRQHRISGTARAVTDCITRALEQRSQMEADRARLENQMAEAAYKSSVDIHVAQLDFLGEHAELELKQMEAFLLEDIEVHGDIAVELGQKCLEAAVMASAAGARRKPAGEESGKKQAHGDAAEPHCDGWNQAAIAMALQAVQAKLEKNRASRRHHKDQLVSKTRAASDALTVCVSTKHDMLTQAMEELQGRTFRLVLSELETRDDVWKTALSAAGRSAVYDEGRKGAEEELLRRTEIQKTADAEWDLEKAQLLQEFLEKSSQSRLRTVTRLRQALLQTRLKAWERMAVGGGFLDEGRALECWRDVMDPSTHQDDGLVAIREQRRHAAERYATRVRKMSTREEKRRALQRDALLQAAFLVTQPRSVTGKGTSMAGGALQSAAEMLAQKKLEDELLQKRRVLQEDLRRDLNAIDESLRLLDQPGKWCGPQASDTDFGEETADCASANGHKDDAPSRIAQAREQRRKHLQTRRVQAVQDFKKLEKNLEWECRARTVEVRHEILQKITDFANEVETSAHQLDNIAAEIAKDLTIKYEEELRQLRQVTAATSPRPPKAQSSRGDIVVEQGESSALSPPEIDIEQQARQLAMTRCQRLILRLKRLEEKGSKMARSLSEEASAELRRLQEKQRDCEAEKRVQLERELAEHEKEKDEAERRLAESLELLHREWEDRLEREEEEGRARLRALQDNARREAGRKLDDQNLGRMKQEIFEMHRTDAARFDEALGAEYWKQMNGLKERLRAKMLARKRRMISAAQEQLTLQGNRLREAKSAFVAKQEAVSFYTPDRQREVVLRVGRAWRDEASRRAAQREAQLDAERATAQEDPLPADVPPLQKLSTSTLDKRLAMLRQAIEKTIAEIHGTVESVTNAGCRRSTARRATVKEFDTLDEATNQISQLLGTLAKLNGVYSSLAHH
ncbi:GCC2 and GCC3 domain-containing protein [Besnoitia besnoiti]|uniref:GCC2 and GCC3 domain-containing protein n=1 Tax=Besnoitia besnoiti TaxID=94643 RepID=A0A2A9MAP1_BESBE|nr:GCC2 and GCC3 domain-containing protein [Besnoitia besnoiti]PFH32687.1 GCC2 and GCC3 domain-containing protein [Besnoitia besnoiti]